MMSLAPTPLALQIFLLAVCSPGWACRQPPPSDRVRVSGQVEATEVQVSALVGGPLIDVPLVEGSHVDAGAVVARLDTTDSLLAMDRARAERDQANAQLQLLRAGSRSEDIRQAEAQVAAARADLAAADAEVAAAQLKWTGSRPCSPRTPDLASSVTMRSRSGMWPANDRKAPVIG